MFVQVISAIVSLATSLANETIPSIVCQFMPEEYPLVSELLMANVTIPCLSSAVFLVILEVIFVGVSHQTLFTLVLVGIFVSIILSKDPHASL